MLNRGEPWQNSSKTEGSTMQPAQKARSGKLRTLSVMPPDKPLAVVTDTRARIRRALGNALSPALIAIH
jgi:hypothetical protein